MDKITIINFGNTTIDPGKPEVLSVEVADYSQVSDGYHTIAELYDHRITLFITLCGVFNAANFDLADACGQGNVEEYAVQNRPWRSKKHSDGSEMDGWFIIGIGKEKGEQISYHLPLSRWDETSFAETLEKAPEWDGHTSQDVLERLRSL